MRILVDNTGLHSAQRCLDKHAIGEVDVLGLLQLATQLVFCETLVVGAYEVSSIRERTESLISDLGTMGVDRTVCQQSSCTEREWTKICRKAGKEFAEDFHDLVPDRALPLRATSPEVTIDQQVPDSGFHELVAREHSAKELSTRAALALERRGAGLVEYTLASCPLLLQTAREEFQRRGGWSHEVSEYLAVLLRIYRNDLAGRSVDAKYSPAVARAGLIRRGNALLHERLDSIVSETVNKLRGNELPLPAVAQALISRSKGDPRGVLCEAARLRHSAAPLRAALSAMVSGNAVGESCQLTFSQLREIGHDLECDLGIVDAPSISSAIDVSLILGIPAISLNAAKLVEWIQYRWQRRRVAVLTELSRSAATVYNPILESKKLTRIATSGR